MPESFLVPVQRLFRVRVASFASLLALGASAGQRPARDGVDDRGDGLHLPLTGGYGVVRSKPHALERTESLRGPLSIVAGAMHSGAMALRAPCQQPDRRGRHRHLSGAGDCGFGQRRKAVLSASLRF
ncbi:MAG: hypothetical protein KatS3mg122_3347 [Caldimonas sp.]|nr:MAG: hypothetical protein KatS3mg122_3347 [Caldimonas sp.]